MRGRIIIGALLATLAFGVPSASAVPVAIQGTPGNDEISILATSAASGTYYVNGVPTLFAGASTVTIDAGAGDDRISVINPEAGTFAPALGVRVNGGDGTDSFTDARGQAAVGWLDHDPADGAGTKTVIHIGAYVQKIVLDSVDGDVSDYVSEQTWTYRGNPGPDNIGLEDTPPLGRGPCCGGQVLTNTGERVDPGAAKSTIVIDTKTGGSSDVVTLAGAWKIASELIVDDGSAQPEDTVRLDSYGYLAQQYAQQNGANNLKVRAAVVQGGGGFYGTSLAVDAGRLDLTDGALHTAVDSLEVQGGNDVHVREADDVQVGGVWTKVSGVRSGAGVASVETPGTLTVLPTEDVAGSDVTISANGLNMLGGAQAPSGTVRLRSQAPGVPMNLGALDDPAGTLSISDGELDRAGAPRVEVGRGDSGPATISAQFDRPTTTLAVTSGGGYAVTSTGSLGADTLELADGSSTGRAWAVDPSKVTVGGATIPYRAGQGLRVGGGSGDDSFAVKASPQVAYSLDGGAGSDSLTYNAEGRTTSGDADPPDGSIESTGVRPVAFGSIEAVSITP
jgi:hypothetical protein